MISQKALCLYHDDANGEKTMIPFSLAYTHPQRVLHMLLLLNSRFTNERNC
jgi:hypothetical protein